jgi:hypothetical protein
MLGPVYDDFRPAAQCEGLRDAPAGARTVCESIFRDFNGCGAIYESIFDLSRF